MLTEWKKKKSTASADSAKAVDAAATKWGEGKHFVFFFLGSLRINSVSKFSKKVVFQTSRNVGNKKCCLGKGNR